MKTRRFFAGNTLPQALMAAARYHGLSPEELAYRLRDKRHGFVNRVRRFIVEVDPAAPLRLRGESRPSPAAAPAVAPVAVPVIAPPGAVAASTVATATGAPAAAGSGRAPRPEGSGSARTAAPAPRTSAPAAPSVPARARTAATVEPFLPPDEESELAAAAAMGRLLALAGLELAAKVERRPDRLVISLGGKDEALLGDLGEEFLDDLEQLAPRAIRGLTGRMVRCRVEGGGLRSAREEELRGLAERTAEQVVASGEPVLLEPLSSADRRIVHLALVDDPRVATESEGYGAEKRVRISPSAPAGSTAAPRPS